MLTTDTETPVVTETTVGTDLLQALEIITEFGVNTVRENLAVLAIDNVLLPVQEPRRDFVLRRVLDDHSRAPCTLAGGRRRRRRKDEDGETHRLDRLVGPELRNLKKLTPVLTENCFLKCSCMY